MACPELPDRQTRLPTVLPVAASRKATPSPRRRNMRLSLLGSAAAAVIAGFGGLWLPIGLVLSVAGGVLASVFAWREVRITRSTLLAEQAEDARRASALLQDSTRRNLGVVKLLSARNDELVGELGRSRAAAAQLQCDAAALRGDKAALQLELKQRGEELAEARSSLAEVKELLDADVVELPVSLVTDTGALDIWTEDGYPTVVQLEALANPPVRELEQRKHA